MKNNPVYIEQEHCSGCLKCIKSCPVKAIGYHAGKACILDDRCVVCGRCYDTCPVEAVQMTSNLPLVRHLIKNNPLIVASLSPAWVSEFSGIGVFRMIEALKLLGFTHVSETSLGANRIADDLVAHLSTKQGLSIYSFCPVVLDQIRKYYPTLTPNIIPLSSPAEAHAQMIRQWYGEQARIVTIDTCIASRETPEAENSPVDASITFDELKNWMQEEGIDPVLMQDVPTYRFEPYAARDCTTYIMEGGMPGDRLAGLNDVKGLKTFHFSGQHKINKILPSLENYRSDNPLFVELFACDGGCLQGRGTIDRINLISKKIALQDYDLENRKHGIHPVPRVFTAKKFESAEIPDTVSSEDVSRILETLMIDTGKELINCGGCGYDTCESFARAVAGGRAENEMCVWYQRQAVQNRFSSLIRALSSGVFVVGADMKIVEANRNFAALMGPEALMIYDADPGMKGVDIMRIAPFHKNISALLENGGESYEKDIQVKERMLKLTLFPLQKHKLVCGLMRNLFLMDVRNDEIISRTRKVIDDNLETVQQIAYLLGRNASRTEAILNSIIESQTVEDGQ